MYGSIFAFSILIVFPVVSISTLTSFTSPPPLLRRHAETHSGLIKARSPLLLTHNSKLNSNYMQNLASGSKFNKVSNTKIAQGKISLTPLKPSSPNEKFKLAAKILDIKIPEMPVSRDQCKPLKPKPIRTIPDLTAEIAQVKKSGCLPKDKSTGDEEGGSSKVGGSVQKRLKSGRFSKSFNLSKNSGALRRRELGPGGSQVKAAVYIGSDAEGKSPVELVEPKLELLAALQWLSVHEVGSVKGKDAEKELASPEFSAWLKLVRRLAAHRLALRYKALYQVLFDKPTNEPDKQPSDVIGSGSSSSEGSALKKGRSLLHWADCVVHNYLFNRAHSDQVLEALKENLLCYRGKPWPPPIPEEIDGKLVS